MQELEIKNLNDWQLRATVNEVKRQYPRSILKELIEEDDLFDSKITKNKRQAQLVFKETVRRLNAVKTLRDEFKAIWYFIEWQRKPPPIKCKQCGDEIEAICFTDLSDMNLEIFTKDYKENGKFPPTIWGYKSCINYRVCEKCYNEVIKPQITVERQAREENQKQNKRYKNY